MKLRKSIILIISSCFAILVLLLLASTRMVTYKKFADIEEDLVASHFRRSLNAINGITSSLNNLTADWAYWDDSYYFLQDRNQEFIDSNLPVETFQSQQNNLILFLNTEKQLVWGAYLPPGKDALSSLPAGTLDILKNLLGAQRAIKQGDGFSGIILVEGTIFLVSCKPVLTSNRTGPGMGWIVMGKAFGPELLEELRERTELDIDIIGIKAGTVPPQYSRLLKAGSAGRGVPFIEKNETTITCSGPISDVEGKPVALLTVANPRTVYRSGVEASGMLLGVIALTGVVIGGLVMWLLEKKILSRIAFLNKQIGAIADSDLSRFSVLSGKDEIAQLSETILGMLLKIQGNIKDLQGMQNSLAESEERYKSLFMNTGNPCMVVAEDMRILLANQEFYKIMKIPAEEKIEGNSWAEFFHEEDVERMRRYHFARRQNESFAPRSYETRYKDRLGRTRHAILTVALIPGSTSSSCSLLDITDQKKAQEELVRKAFYDSLTELPNRQLFKNRLAHEIIHTQRTNAGIGVMLLDIDEFKSVNDTLGHQAGDEILRQIAARMSACIRKSDTIARLGGDEFAIMIDNAPNVDCLCQIAEKLIADFTAPYVTNNLEFFLGVSVGIAVFPEAGDTPEDLLKNADLAMYESKLKGKNGYNIFTHSLNEQAQRRQVVDRFIRHAIASDSFEVFYQPKVSLVDGSLGGMEALVRGKDAEGNVVSPGEFIPYAEANGLIVPIDLLVLKKACRQTAQWNRGRPEQLAVAVNISTKHFRRQSFVEEVEAILQETGLPGACLELEITESALMKDIDQAIASLVRLRGLGITIALDDFGTGYSSLNYLHNLPITTMKIDKSFIDHVCDTTSGTLELVRIIVSLASSMQLQVVAEGVETLEQCRVLQEMNCALCQGYFFSRPLPEANFSELLRNGGQDGRWSGLGLF